VKERAIGGKRPLKATRCTTPLADRSPRLPLLGRNSSSKVHVHEEGLIVRVPTRGCHGYFPEEYIHALYPYPLRIRADDAYPKCITRKRGEDISILSDKNCEIISDAYPRYESQDTGIYKMIRLLAPAEFQ